MYEKVTDRARKVMELANEEAHSLGADAYIDTDHLLLGLIKEGDGVAAHVLKELGLNDNIVRDQADRIAPAEANRERMRKHPLTPQLKKVIENSFEEATKLSHQYVGTEHLLLALATLEEGAAAHILSNLGVERQAIRRSVFEILGHPVDG